MDGGSGYKDKRILFIETRGEQDKTSYESMMPNRIYVFVGNNNRRLKSITFIDKKDFSYKFIDVKAKHHDIGKDKLGHTHMGYDRKATREMTRREHKFVKKIIKAYYMGKYLKRKGGITQWLKSIKYSRHGKT